LISQINNEAIDHKLEAYDYFLDSSLIASKPSAIRHESRLMIVRDSILDLISQERVYKLNKKQTILSIISNLNKIIKLQ